MRGDGTDIDTLDGVIKALEKVKRTWRNGWNCLQYPDLRDAIMYLNRYKMEMERPLGERLIDVLREVRGEK